MYEGWTQQEIEIHAGRARLVKAALDLHAEGLTDFAAATRLGVSPSTLCRLKQAWAMAQESGNQRLLLPGKSTGRKPKIVLGTASATYLRKLLVKSNLQTGRGSMTSAARYAARTHDPDNPLTDAERAAILDCGKSKHNLSVSIRRAMRGADAVIADYRDQRTMKLGGAYAPGTIRMIADPLTGEFRRLHAGERWCSDDGSVNFCVCVPWPWGGDPCSDRYGVRVGRYQLLPIVDVRGDRCMAWSYTMRSKDSYRADDVVALYNHAFSLCGYAPAEMVSEGGVWQSRRVLEFLRQAGVNVVDAQGRPHQKVIEPWFGRLWIALSMKTDGQIGRYRGEMRQENELLAKCQAGSLDPRRVFPMLESAMNALEWAIPYVNGERVESKEYGTWIPEEDHARSIAAHPRPAYSLDLGYLAMRVRECVTVRRFGMVAVTADSPVGFARKYHFSSPDLIPFNRARVWVHFDPMQTPVEAAVTLAADFEDRRAGDVVARGLSCLNSAPELMRDEVGVWHIGWSDGIGETVRAKRLSRLAVRRELRALSLDGKRVAAISEISAPEGVTKQLGIAHADAEEAARENDLPRIMSREELMSKTA